MNRRIQRSDWFIADLEHYAARYDREAGWEVAERYLRSVSATITRLAELPEIGHRTFFSAPELKELRCHPVRRPFQKHLIFYRYDESNLYLERAVHGARDLPRRLTEAPELEE